jgi:hypothetical protein
LMGTLCKYGYQGLNFLILFSLYLSLFCKTVNHMVVTKALTAFAPLFEDDSIPNLRDNLCGAICRIIDASDAKGNFSFMFYLFNQICLFFPFVCLQTFHFHNC